MNGTAVQELPDDVHRLIRLAIEEDLGQGDLTTEAIIPPDQRAHARIVAQTPLTLAGLPVAQAVFRQIDPQCQFQDFHRDGEDVAEGEGITAIVGKAQALLNGERTALNFLHRLCGISTLSRRCARRANPLELLVLDTRKTAPGHRWLEKYAVRVGGCTNHRQHLGDGALIKDNHIRLIGSVREAIRRFREATPMATDLEVEVEDMGQLREALEAGAELLLLDNMTAAELQEAVKAVGGKAVLEASGGINLDQLEPIARAGIQRMSLGALTHSAPIAELTMIIDPLAEQPSCE